MIKTTWNGLKACKDRNDASLILYSVEDEYRSNVDSIPDIQRYYIRLVNTNNEIYCFITITDPKSEDQIDFEQNYKPEGIGE
jgi:hypothetical protein